MTILLVAATLFTVSGLMIFGLLQLWEGMSNNHEKF